MANDVELIYCADGNKRFAQIAIDAGFLYGAQLPPRGLHFSPHFVDQDWKNPNLDRYAAEVEKHKPYIASVLDLERYDQFDEVLMWSETIAPFVQELMIIPKAHGIISLIPRKIGGRSVRLGFSVPTKYGGTAVSYYEFIGWPVHLLGGSPHRQLRLSAFLNVVSTDGNYAQKMAVQFNTFWRSGKWVRLDECGNRIENDAPYAAFERSCRNIKSAWQRRHSCPTTHAADKNGRQMILI